MALRSNTSNAMSYRGVLARQQGRKLSEGSTDVAAALARLSQTPDGDLFLTWIHQQTFGRAVPDDASEGALRAAEVRRSFATLIFNVLERGLKANASPRRTGK